MSKATEETTERARRAYDRSQSDEELREAFLAGDLPVAVYGLGKMGLPVAAVFADVCGNVTGVDVDESVVAAVSAGECPVEGGTDLPVLVSKVVQEDALSATSDVASAATDATVHVLLATTSLDGDEPDLSALERSLREVATGLAPGDVVFVESTVPPRTTENAIAPALAELSGLDPGTFGVAACPERTASGNAVADVRGSYPKIVGGVDAESTRVARVVYDALTSNEVVTTTDAATAETAKVIEGVYRHVTVALANELATYSRALDVDVTEAISVANTQPQCELHDRRPGVGTHCAPVYPHFITGAFDVDAPLVRTARTVNERMPAYAVALLEAMLDEHGVGDGPPTILLLGLASRGNVAERRNAPGATVAEKLASCGARVVAVDPLVDDWDAPERVARASLDELDDEDIGRGVDAVAVLADHDEFAAVDWTNLDAPVLDGRDVVPEDSSATVYAIGGRWP
jgi:UDP-N-acetyl-D-mannosaminuronic acid dehydrogenase